MQEGPGQCQSSRRRKCKNQGSPVIGERMMSKNEWTKEEQWQDKGRQVQKSLKMQEKSLQLKLNQDAGRSPIDTRRQEKALLSWKETSKLILKGPTGEEEDLDQ